MYGSGPFISSCFRYSVFFAHDCATNRFGEPCWAHVALMGSGMGLGMEFGMEFGMGLGMGLGMASVMGLPIGLGMGLNIKTQPDFYP